MLLSFERPPAVARLRAGLRRLTRWVTLSPNLENCTDSQTNMGITDPELSSSGFDHRQDMKGTRWMPWHQESKKGVDDCEKPRLGVEQPLTRGFPNG